MQLSKQVKILLIGFLVLIIQNELLGEDTYCPVDSLLEQIIKEENIVPGEEFRNAELNIDELIEIVDTACVIKVCRMYTRKGSNSYNVVFKTLWRALLLADQSNSDVEKFIVNIDIARFYSYLNRYDKAIEHFATASKLKKKLTAANELTNTM